MKKFNFLLLDAGPVIGLFELGVHIWELFIEKCNVTITETVESEAIFASNTTIDLNSYRDSGRINIVDVDVSRVKNFLDQLNPAYKDSIHDGEKESLAFLCDSDEEWKICAADGSVFRVMGLLGKRDQSISLEEILGEIGLQQSGLHWKYTKKFREKYIGEGEKDRTAGFNL